MMGGDGVVAADGRLWVLDSVAGLLLRLPSLSLGPSNRLANMARAVVLSAVRTPVGRYGGALSGERPDDLAATVIAAAVERAGVPAGRSRTSTSAAANQAGEDNRNVARMASLLAGLPQSVAGVTLNRLCASGLSAVVSACHAVAAGDGDLFVAGGVESMSRAPLVLAKPERAFPRGDQTIWDTTLGWRFPNPRLEEMFPLESMGETGENVAERSGCRARSRMPSRSSRSGAGRRQTRRGASRTSSFRSATSCVTSIRGPTPSAGEAGRVEAGVPRGGTVTAGNSSGLNDGAAALVIASEERARELGAEPLAPFVG